ncbi:MAG: beta-N-acetylhexosaminidase [Clostridiales bacterium]|nr:beta-N-acetylhexosaminidase [Clostridiales bacterium]
MKILPNPQKSENISGAFLVDEHSKVYTDGSFDKQVERFVTLVQESAGFRLEFTDVIEEAQIIFNHTEECPQEGYVVSISQSVATVSASTKIGCFYAVETLRQIFALDTSQTNIMCANCYIKDAPKFAYRGLLVDIARHFFDLDTLKQIVELMSQVKLNKLHVHLSDDQGFRLQIDKYPQLVTVGSNRQGTETVKDGKRYVDETPYGGYLTKDDVRELVKFAAEHNVDVIPEIDVPGHFVAALASYPEYSCTGAVNEVRKTWGISKDILCAGNDRSYDFIRDILDEVCELFPSEYVHLGGDEVPKDRWCNCRLCRERMSELKLNDYDELQTYMVEQFRIHLEAKGKTVICWNDGITKDASTEIVSQIWQPFKQRSAASHTKTGRKVIISPYFNAYFGLPYAMTPLNKTLKLNPFKGVPRSKRNNVLGVEGTLWTEYVDSVDKLFFHLLPRLDALSECAWGYHKGGFNKRLVRRQNLYDNLNLTFNVNATKRKLFGRLATTKHFFRKDSDVEYNKHRSI